MRPKTPVQMISIFARNFWTTRKRLCAHPGRSPQTQEFLDLADVGDWHRYHECRHVDVEDGIDNSRTRHRAGMADIGWASSRSAWRGHRLGDDHDDDGHD